MKTQKHLPIFGVGPIYVFTIAVLTFAAYRMRNLPALSSGRIDVLQKPLFILGVILIVLGVFIWFQAAVVSRLLDGIVKNRLVTTEIYACVRNPHLPGVHDRLHRGDPHGRKPLVFLPSVRFLGFHDRADEAHRGTMAA